ncbi:hypothetical protein ACFLU5_01295 [Bacteroidota bacterium]
MIQSIEKTDAKRGDLRLAQKGKGSRRIEWYEDDTSEKDTWFKNGYISRCIDDV